MKCEVSTCTTLVRCYFQTHCECMDVFPSCVKGERQTGHCAVRNVGNVMPQTELTLQYGPTDQRELTQGEQSVREVETQKIDVFTDTVDITVAPGTVPIAQEHLAKLVLIENCSVLSVSGSVLLN